MSKTDNEYRRAANLTVIAAGIAVALYLIFKYAVLAAAPFLLAALVSAIVTPAARKLSKWTKIPQKPLAALLILLFFGAAALSVYLASAKLLREAGDLLERLSSDTEAVTAALSRLTDAISAFTERSKLFKNAEIKDTLLAFGIDTERLFSDAVRSLAARLTEWLSGFVAGSAAKIPSLLFFTATFLISAFYLAADGERIGGYFSALLPDRWQKKLPLLKEKTSRTLTGYLKAYLLIMLLTFSEVLIGLSILRVKYALLMSIIVAVVDILPILGTGAVLIPWAILAYAGGNPRLGTGLLILYGVLLILRQIAEPRIVGDSIGLHPLATLASVYLGIKLAGIAGIFIGPMAALFLKSFHAGEETAGNASAPAQGRQTKNCNLKT